VALLEDVEWGGDVVNGLVIALIGGGLISFGYAWGGSRAIYAMAALLTIPLVASDVLYFGFGVNLLGYCGEPKCDPGPIPVTLGLVFLPPALVLTWVGVVIRRRASCA
jgi:hypothetical protein